MLNMIYMKSFGSKPWMLPQPVLIIGTYNEDGTPNAMNAAWGGIHDTNQIGICLSPEHKTVKNILDRKAFTVSMADAKHVVACDFVGIVSGNKDPEKMQKSGFTVSKSDIVDAPVINELPMALECRLVSYDEDSGYMVGDIVNVCADEDVLTDGKIYKGTTTETASKIVTCSNTGDAYVGVASMRAASSYQRRVAGEPCTGGRSRPTQRQRVRRHR